MKYKSFRILKIAVTFFLAIIIAQAIIFNNYILAIAAVIAGVAIVFALRKKVEGVTADERDFQIAGKSARLSLSIFCVLTAMATFVFMFQRDANPIYEVIGSTLAYSVCALLLLYSIIFTYYEKQN